jgi:hypothetical protein
MDRIDLAGVEAGCQPNTVKLSQNDLYDWLLGTFF